MIGLTQTSLHVVCQCIGLTVRPACPCCKGSERPDRRSCFCCSQSRCLDKSVALTAHPSLLQSTAMTAIVIALRKGIPAEDLKGMVEAAAAALAAAAEQATAKASPTALLMAPPSLKAEASTPIAAPLDALAQEVCHCPCSKTCSQSWCLRLLDSLSMCSCTRSISSRGVACSSSRWTAHSAVAK